MSRHAFDRPRGPHLTIVSYNLDTFAVLDQVLVIMKPPVVDNPRYGRTTPRFSASIVLTLLTSIGIKAAKVTGQVVIGQHFGDLHYPKGRPSYPPFIW